MSQRIDSNESPSKSGNIKERNIHSLTPKQKIIHHQTVKRHLSNRRSPVPTPIHSQSGTGDRSAIRVSKDTSQGIHGDIIQEPDFKFDEETSQSRTQSILNELPTFPQRGKHSIRKNYSAPHLSVVQQEKIESQLYLHPTAIPRSLSATFADYRPDMALSILMDLPMGAYMGVGGGSVKSMLQRALKQVDDELVTLETIVSSDDEEEFRMDSTPSRSQGIPTAPDEIPPTMLEHDLSAYRVGIIAEELPLPTPPTMTRKSDMKRVDSRAAAMSVKHDIEHALKQGYTFNLIIAVLQALIGAFLYGWNIAILNVPRNTVQTDETKMNDTQYAMLATMFCAGGLIGALISGPMQDHIGRKKMLLVIDVICLISTVITYIYAIGGFGELDDTFGYILFWFGRFTMGIASGAATAVVPTYLGEIAPPLIRGAIGTSNQLTVCFGIFAVEFVGCPNLLGGDNTWQYLFLGNVLPVVQLLTAWSFPESPKWLVQKGRDSEARRALQKLRQTMDVRVDMMLMKGGLIHERKTTSIGSEYDLSAKHDKNIKYRTSKQEPLLDNVDGDEQIQIEDGNVQYEIAVEVHSNGNGVVKQIQKRSIEVTSGDEYKVKERAPFGMTNDMWKAVKWATIIAIVLMFTQQMCGINAVFYYSATILQNAGVTSDRALWLGSLGISIANFFAVFIAVFSIDRVGRKLLLIISGSVMICACVLVSIAISLEGNGNTFWQYSSIVFLILFVIGFEIGLGAIPWLMMAELSPMQYRGAIVAIATGSNWAFNLLIAQFSGPIITYFYFYPFGIVCVIGIVFTIKYIPETNGKTATEIQKELINL